jgi:class 3 adenylate cyclase/tetratricopeptide (TPR) repeat protein
MARDEISERRQLTVVFCDLVDSTALSSSLDPEDYRDLVHAFRSLCEEVVVRLSGFVAQYMGDGVLVYFGYPAAQEDAAVRAVTAGLRIVAEANALAGAATLPPGWQLRVRVGIHAGVVVTPLADIAQRGAELALGPAPNIAARLQGIATPGSVVVSQHIHRLASGHFDFESLGEHDLKGVPEPLALYRVQRHRAVSSTFDASLVLGLSPFLEREDVRAAVTGLWPQVLAGHGSNVLLRGEPGVGKSRIVHELRAWLQPEPRWIRATCSEHARNSSFSCIASALAHWATIEVEDDRAARLTKLERALDDAGLIAPDYLAVAAELLDAPLPAERVVPTHLGSQELRSATISVLVRLLLALPGRGPLALCFEDLHWVDPSSEEVIARVLNATSDAQLLCVCTSRASFSWSAPVPGVTFELGPLSPAAIRDLTRRLSDGHCSDAVVERIAQQSDGVPLFVEELTRAVLETSAVTTPGSSHVPASLQDSLMARLDRLPDGRLVAQLASICGRHFSYGMLNVLTPLDADTVSRGVGQLLDAGIVKRLGASQFAFKHALVRDAAYDSMLRATRRRYHLTVAQTLRRELERVGSSQPDLLAHHYFEGGRATEAAELWLLAAQRSADKAAIKEAESHLGHVLLALKGVASEDERNELELRAQMVSGQLAITNQGYAAPAVELAFTRALELCKQLGHVSSTSDVTKLLASRVLCSDDLNKLRPASNPLFWVLWGFGAFYQARAEHRRALEIGQHLLRMAAGNPDLLVEGYFGAGSSLYYLGRFAEAADYLLRGFEISRHVDHSAATPTGHRADFLCLGYASLALWHLGEWDRASALNAQAFELAQSLSQPYLAASGYAMRASLLHLMRDTRGCLDASDAALELADKYGFGFVKLWVKPLLGWAMVQTTSNALGLGLIREALSAYAQSSTSVFRTHVLGVAADCHAWLGDFTSAQSCVEEALQLADETGERFCEPELFRLRATVELGRPVPDLELSLAALRRALRQAREQQAWAIEARVARQMDELGAFEPVASLGRERALAPGDSVALRAASH